MASRFVRGLIDIIQGFRERRQCHGTIHLEIPDLIIDLMGHTDKAPLILPENGVPHIIRGFVHFYFISARYRFRRFITNVVIGKI